MNIKPIPVPSFDVLEALQLGLEALRQGKPNDRSEADRLYAVAITEQQKVIGFFKTWVVDADARTQAVSEGYTNLKAADALEITSSPGE